MSSVRGDKEPWIGELGPRSLVPKPVPGLDMRRLDLSPREGFVLTRVDGFCTLGEICAMAGLPDAPDILRRLVDLGAITIAGLSPRPVAARRASAPAPATAAATATAPAPATATATASTPADHAAAEARVKALLAPVDVDAALLAEANDLEPELRREILALHQCLGQLTYYELLGLHPRASRADVKRAYFRLSKRFHPDLYFRKQLGSYLPRLQDIFKRLTAAYECLCDDGQRAAYDALVLDEAGR